MQTILHRTFKQVKRLLPAPIANAMRNSVTAMLTPFMFSYHSGHFKSSFRMKAVDKAGNPLPWYTYPCIDFLLRRNFKQKRVMEFGGGQSSVWWGQQAQSVLTFEGNKEWYEKIKSDMPVNVSLHHVSDADAPTCLAAINAVLATQTNTQFDVIIIDGLWRYELISLAVSHLAPEGVIICDNSEGYEFREGFDSTNLQRVDFYGFASGCIMRTCTSLFFPSQSFIFANSNPLATNGYN